MTFEEWWGIDGKWISDYEDEARQKIIMQKTWHAAKEDSKPVARIVERKLYGMNNTEYSIIGFDGFESAIRSTKEQAEQWVIENGYRIAES